MTSLQLAERVHQIQREVAAEGTKLEATYLARRIQCPGYVFKIRTALGGSCAGSCLRQLRHFFLTCSSSGAATSITSLEKSVCWWDVTLCPASKHVWLSLTTEVVSLENGQKNQERHPRIHGFEQLVLSTNVLHTGLRTAAFKDFGNWHVWVCRGSRHRVLCDWSSLQGAVWDCQSFQEVCQIAVRAAGWSGACGGALGQPRQSSQQRDEGVLPGTTRMVSPEPGQCNIALADMKHSYTFVKLASTCCVKLFAWSDVWPTCSCNLTFQISTGNLIAGNRHNSATMEALFKHDVQVET